jgi:hypothetical protein
MSTPRILLSAFVACVVFLSTAYRNSGTSATLSAAQGAAKVANPITGEGLPNPAPKVTRNWGQIRSTETSGPTSAAARARLAGPRAPGSRATATSSIPSSSSTAIPVRCWQTSARA